MSGIHYLKEFDKKQLFRFFVDGRFHSKYSGWVGYENGEPGSVRAMLNGFSYMIDNFDLSEGLKSNYIVELHKRCMFNVSTTNLKSTPGDLRYLNSGMPFFHKTTTKEHLVETLQMRNMDDTVVFNNKKFAKLSENISLKELQDFLKTEGKLSYRPWYPNLTKDMEKALNHKKSLAEFYEVKGYVQRKFAEKIDQIVLEFNTNIVTAKTDNEIILVISKIVRDLEMLHPFPDGNCRTFANVLLNHLLLFHNFHPSILVNPNLDGECSYEQFAKVIQDGIENTKFLLENPEEKLYNFSILSLSDTENKRFLKICEEFLEKLDGYKEIYLTPEKLKRLTSGKWINNCEYTRFSSIGSHTTVPNGCLYFCFTKDWEKSNKNIEAEILKATNKGAVALIVDDEKYINLTKKPTLLVDDCEKQMVNLAHSVRREVDCSAVLVTGTVGKTGFKFQLNHCLKQQTKIHAFLNSINTKIPILRTLLSLEEDDKVEVVELSVGSSHKDATNRSKMIDPNICVFTDVDQNHMNIHKTIENLVKAKSSTVSGLKDDGICIINSSANLYNEILVEIKKIKPNAKIVTFGDNEDDNAKIISKKFNNNDFSWDIQADIENEIVNYNLPVFHNHAPNQSLGILLSIKYLGYDVKKAGLDYSNNFDSFSSIGRIFKLSFDNKNILFYDQSYRGSIIGMQSAFEDIKNMNLDKRKVFVLAGSSVKEDNEFTKSQHKEIANLLNNSGVDRLYTTGPYTNYIYDDLLDKSVLVKHTDDFDELESVLRDDLQDDDFLFMMGSGDLYLGKLGAKVLKFGKSEVIR